MKREQEANLKHRNEFLKRLISIETDVSMVKG